LVDALVDLIGEEPKLELVGVAHNEAEAVALAQSTRPNIVLFDVEAVTADASLVSVIHGLQTAGSGARLIALTNYDDDATVQRILTWGFHRHVSKVMNGKDLVTIVLEEHVQLA
jgi:DNA-binding NarL/FixJ family response regulator